MRISAFITDQRKENEGVWVPLGAGAQVLVARVGNEKYKQSFLRHSKPHRTQLRTGNLEEDAAQKLLNKVMAETVLLDWKGLEDDDGNDILYSTEKAEELLAIKDFRETIEEIANTRELYRQHEMADAGN